MPRVDGMNVWWFLGTAVIVVDLAVVVAVMVGARRSAGFPLAWPDPRLNAAAFPVVALGAAASGALVAVGWALSGFTGGAAPWVLAAILLLGASLAAGGAVGRAVLRRVRD